MNLSSPRMDERSKVLVVDDEKFIRDILADFLGMEGYTVRTAEDGVSALSELSRSHYDLVISDLKMPKMGGIELLDAIARTYPNVLTVIMTGFGTVETAIDAMKRGAYDYILKPFKVEEVIHVVQRGIDKQRLSAENLRLKEALSLYKVSEAIATSLSLDDVVANLGETALNEIKADFVSTWLEDGSGDYFERSRLYPEEERLSSATLEIIAAGVPVASPHVTAPSMRVSNAAGPPSAPTGEFNRGTIAPEAFLERLKAEPFVLVHNQDASVFFSKAADYPVTSLLAVPLRMKSRLLGWITAISFSRSRKFDEGNRKLLAIVASRAAATIENARLYEDLQATFQQTIHGLAQAIDKMDRYTSGHSERVAMYAMKLAVKMGLPPEMVEVVRQSALMHDIGKIGCALNLNKPGKLTPEEYEIFQKHPGYGKEILDPIKFLHPLIPGVHLHHERWDGRGYPLKLQGKDIPIIARIIAVADTYDAMTSDRAYRSALPHDVAVGEIERCAKSQFDPDVAGIFCEELEAYRDEAASRGEKIPE